MSERIKSLFIKEQAYIYAIMAMFALLTMLSWNKCGRFITFDAMRELIVPYLMTKGLVLYEDIFYFYPPLIPYAFAFIVEIIGVHIKTIIIFDLSLIFIYCFTLYILSRAYLNQIYSLVVVLLFLLQAAFFYLGTFVYPYSLAALLGSLIYTIIITLLAYYYILKRDKLLYIASFLSSLLFLIKQDYAIAGTVILIFFFILITIEESNIFAYKTLNESLKQIFYKIPVKKILTCLVILVSLPLLVYSVIAFQIGVSELYNSLFVVHLSDTLPYKHFSGVLGGDPTLTNILNAFIFGFTSFILLCSIILFCYLILFCINIVLNSNSKSKKFFIIIGIIISVVVLLNVFSHYNQFVIQCLVFFIENLKHIYSGINIWLLLLLLYLVFSLKSRPAYNLIFLVVAASLITYRVYFNMSLHIYGFYYLPVALVVFVYIMTVFFPDLCSKSLNFSKDMLSKSINLFFIILILVYFIFDISIFTRIYKIVKSPVGYYSCIDKEEYAITIAIQECSEYIKNNSNPDEKILAFTFFPLIYYYSDRLPANRVYYLESLLTDNLNYEKRFIKELEQNMPRFITISSDIYDKYSDPIGYGYEYKDSLFYDWINKNYQEIKRINTETDWYISIYQKNNI